MKNINSDLKKLLYTVDPYFNSRVMEKIMYSSNEMWNNFRIKFILPAVASVAICLLMVIIQDGGISYDSILGTAELDSKLTEILMYY